MRWMREAVLFFVVMPILAAAVFAVAASDGQPAVADGAPAGDSVNPAGTEPEAATAGAGDSSETHRDMAPAGEAALTKAAAQKTHGERAQEIAVVARPLMPVLVPGKNDTHPLWSPNGELLSFERSVNGKQEIMISRRDGTVVKRIYYKSTPEKGDMGLALLLPELAQASVSYNAALTWSPRSDRFVFMSNAGEGNYDLYIDGVNEDSVRRLTDNPYKDGQADWSPARDEVAFISGRSGNALVYILDLQSGATTAITRGVDTYLFPRWSPDGRSIAVMYGSNSNHDILVVRDVTDAGSSTAALSVWEYDDISPTWSPDGSKVAFYSNYNSSGDAKMWSIVVVNAAGGDPVAGEGMQRLVVAENVVPDVASGPAWLPDSAHIAYVFNDKTDYNPIFIVDVRSHQARKLLTGTAINHDINISALGIMAFRAQVDQWDHIFLTDLTAIGQ